MPIWWEYSHLATLQKQLINTRTTQKPKGKQIKFCSKDPQNDGKTDSKSEGEEVVVTEGEGGRVGGRGHRVEYHKNAKSSEDNKVRFSGDIFSRPLRLMM